MNTQEISEQVVKDAVAGQPKAIGTVIEALKGPVYNLALRMLSRPSDAEDACQEALLKIATNLNTFRGDSRLTTWAYSVAARTILDVRRGSARQAAFSLEEFREDLADGLEKNAASNIEDTVYTGQILVGCARRYSCVWTETTALPMWLVRSWTCPDPKAHGYATSAKQPSANDSPGRGNASKMP